MKVTVQNKNGLNKDLKVLVDKKTLEKYLNEKYEERGTGPEFNVVVEDGKRRLNNILDNVVVNDKNENAVTIIDNGVEKIINKDDKEWNYYFGPFSKENQLKLQLAQQRMKENNEKMIKMQNKNKEDEFLKKIMSQNKKFSVF